MCILFSSLYSLLFSLLQLVLIFVVGGLVFHCSFGSLNVVATGVIFLLSVVLFVSFSIISAAFIIALKKGDPFGWLLTPVETSSWMGVLSGRRDAGVAAGGRQIRSRYLFARRVTACDSQRVLALAAFESGARTSVHRRGFPALEPLRVRLCGRSGEEEWIAGLLLTGAASGQEYSLPHNLCRNSFQGSTVTVPMRLG